MTALHIFRFTSCQNIAVTKGLFINYVIFYKGFLPKGRILAYKTAHFLTFRTVNDHFWSIGDHRWKSSFLVPDQSSGVQNDQLGRAEKMDRRKGVKTIF